MADLRDSNGQMPLLDLPSDLSEGQAERLVVVLARVLVAQALREVLPEESATSDHRATLEDGD